MYGILNEEDVAKLQKWLDNPRGKLDLERLTFMTHESENLQDYVLVLFNGPGGY